MNARNWLLLLPILMTSLQACAPVNRASPLAVAVPSSPAAIKQQLAPMCAEPMNDDDLELSATVAETHRADKPVIEVVRRLDRMDRETRICRGVP